MALKHIYFNNKHFKDSPLLRELFYKNTLKFSSSFTSNLEKLISNHNSKFLEEDGKTEVKKCNCSVEKACPLNVYV